ncbi:MAG: hypothetical protein RLO52_30650 [Sandaracinaceae bacterium]|nr:hypothetical protein [Myxococcales bacterium]
MKPVLHRGIGWPRGVTRVASLVIVYVGAFAVLWGLGLVVRGWQGWILLTAPLVLWITSRLWAWHRVGVEVTEDRLRYEGANPRRDFEVRLKSIKAVYFDDLIPGRPLVLVLDDGDERVVGELSRKAARAVAKLLIERGVPRIRARRRSSSA